MIGAGTKPVRKNAAASIGSLEEVLAHAERLLDANPALAERQALEIVRAIPNQPDALRILAIAKRRSGDLAASRSALRHLTELQPCDARAHYELGLTEAALGSADAAKESLRRATELRPDMSDAWRALGDQHTLAGDVAQADAAYARQIRASVTNPILMQAATALVDHRLAVAERLLKDFLKQYPTDVAAIRMLAEVAAKIGRYADAEALLRRCLALSPGFHAARHNYAIALYRQGKAAEALPEVDRLLEMEPGDPGLRNLKAALLSHLGEYQQTLALYAEVLSEYPRQPKAWMSYGHALKTTGRVDEGIAAYRRAIAQAPHLGEAYWSLANLKTFRFTDADTKAMRDQLARSDLADDDRLHFHFALGKALEDTGEFGASFAQYSAGNRIRKEQLGYRATETTERVERTIALFSPDFCRRRAPAGCDAPDPIFIVGLPRSGSTLIEQILSSHSAVEGTMELPDIPAMAMALGAKRNRSDPSRYPEILAELDRDRLQALGREYLARTRAQRKTGRPFFIDKTPQNFLHLGMIRLILPHAKIIDARRHPLAACVAGFKQHFARGQAFSYGLEDLGQYYRDYVALMAHFDSVMPGRIHRVFYERMVTDTETEIRRLLAYCELPFEPNCLRFHENERAVRTPSSEQVRRPIFRDGVDHWRHFQPWLGPLEACLGDVLAAYPECRLTPQGGQIDQQTVQNGPQSGSINKGEIDVSGELAR